MWVREHVSAQTRGSSGFLLALIAASFGGANAHGFTGLGHCAVVIRRAVAAEIGVYMSETGAAAGNSGELFRSQEAFRPSLAVLLHLLADMA